MKTLYSLFALAVLAVAQDVLTNESIIKMLKAGLGESVVLSMVQTQPAKYSVTTDDLVRLKGQGVPDKVLAAMVAKGTSSSASAATPVDTDLQQDAEIGVYYRKDGKWEQALPEVVNWKTGGVLKHYATAGVVKGDVNGHIQGSHSRNSAKSPVEVLIYVADGVAITEYQLLHLHDTPDSREFRTVTGGVLHESGGATRDLVPFEGKKVSKGAYKVLLPSLGAGEYGFLPPGATSSSNSASMGKMYTFRLVE